MLAAVVLWAFERHLDGRRDHALYLGVAAALLRPEAWPFLALYGLWLWFFEPRLRGRLVAFAVLVPGVLVPAGVVGVGRPAPRRLARERAQPGQRGLRRASRRLRAVQALRARCTVAPVELGHDRRGRRCRRGVVAPTGAGGGARARGAGFAWFAARGRDDGGAASPATSAT